MHWVAETRQLTCHEVPGLELFVSTLNGGRRTFRKIWKNIQYDHAMLKCHESFENKLRNEGTNMPWIFLPRSQNEGTNMGGFNNQSLGFYVSSHRRSRRSNFKAIMVRRRQTSNSKAMNYDDASLVQGWGDSPHMPSHDGYRRLSCCFVTLITTLCSPLPTHHLL